MAKTNLKKSGNENFKTWLKRLDPAARVEKMSAIAKTQHSAGLKGSSIRASLAQLSQRCHVMLMKLTDEEIKFYSRTPSVKRIQDQEQKNKMNESIIFDKQSPNTTLQDSKTHDLHQRTSNLHTKNKTIPSPTLKPSHNKKLKDSGCRKRPNNDRLEERYKELFGDFDDNTSVVKIKAPKLHNTHTSISGNTIDKVLSTTINTNIYDSSSNNEAKNSISSKRTHCSEKTVHGSNETCNRLKIDGSLHKSSGSSSFEARSVRKKKSKSKVSVMSYKGRKQSRVTNSSKHDTLVEKKNNDQINSDMLVLSALDNDHSEDAAPIKELWKIFGMESPTDRSESIIKSFPNPQSLNLKVITNNKNNMLNVLSNREQENEALTKPSAASTINSILIKETLNNTKDHENVDNNFAARRNINSVSIVSESVKNNSADRGNVNNVSDHKEPFCKIAETFSLAKLNPGSLCDGLTSNYENESCGNIITTKGLSIYSGVQPNKNGETGLCSIETISLCHDDEEEDFIDTSSSKNQNNRVSQKAIKPLSKVGTIRVKNLGLLLDPQKVPHECNITETSNTQVQDYKEPLSINKKEAKSVEEIFFDYYKDYFDELLESKILKLGELLHLAVSDEIRKKERIKRAEQLSSSDLISEEILRANKDFKEMMNVRGSEFAPIVDVILKQFVRTTKVTLFFALFIRIFERAKEIDIENSNHLLAAKEVFKTMLLNTTHKDIYSALTSSPDEFFQQVHKISLLLTMFRTKHSLQINDTTSISVVSPHSNSKNLTMTKNKSQPQEVINSNNQYRNLANTETAINANPQTTTNNAAISQTINYPKSGSSSLKLSSNQPTLTSNAPSLNIDTNNITNSPSQRLHLNTDSLQYNPVFDQNVPTSLTLSNVHYLSSPQKVDSGIKCTPPEQTHSVVNRLGTKLDHISRQQHKHLFPMIPNANFSSSSLFGLYPNTSLTPLHLNETLNEPTNAAIGNRRKSSTSKLNMTSLGTAPQAVHGVSAIRQQAVHTQPSTLLENTNDLNISAILRQPTSNLNKYNSANTITSLPDLNNMIRNQTESNCVPQQKGLETSNIIIPGQEGLAIRQETFLEKQTTRRDFTVIRNLKNPPGNTNFNSLQTQPKSKFNENNLTTAKSIINKVVGLMLTGNRRGQRVSISYGKTDQQSNDISVSNQMNVNERPFSSLLVENACASNLNVNSQLINSSSNGQQYTSTTGSTPLLVSVLSPESCTAHESRYPVLVTNKSTAIQPQEQNVSINSTVNSTISYNSRSENINSSNINITCLLKKQSDSSSRQCDSSVPTPMSNSTSLRMDTSIREGKATVHSSYTNSVAGPQQSTLSASQVGCTTETYCESQVSQSSKSKITSESQLMSSHRMPVTMAPPLYPEPVTEPTVSRLSTTVTVFANRQEPTQSNSTSSMPGYAGTTSNLHSSAPRKSSSSSVQSVLTQPTVPPPQSLPTSSHCHPFIRRMPISGKMKMFFGNK